MLGLSQQWLFFLPKKPNIHSYPPEVIAMMNSYYKETALEEWIKTLYIKIGITTPMNIDIHVIADRLGIRIVYEKCRPFSDANMQVVFLDKRDSSTISKLTFFHELCHLLRHAGDQRLLPALFREAQEIEANQFAMYAATPFFMILGLELPERNNLAVQYLADIFKVPINFAKKRLGQIERRILQGKLDEAKSKKSSLNLISSNMEDSIDEPYLIYSYYDFTDDVSGPSQLILRLNDSLISSISQLDVDIVAPFKQLDDEEAGKFRYTSLDINDLNYRDGRLQLNFDVLRLRYGKISNRLVIQMRDVEALMRYEWEISNF